MYCPNWRRFAVTIVLLGVSSSAQRAIAQPDSAGRVHVSGVATLSLDVNRFISEPGALAPPPPAELTRLTLRMALKTGPSFSMPINMTLNEPYTGTSIPRDTSGDILAYLRRPGNMISIAPTFGPAMLTLGAQAPAYSDLTLTDIPIFGAGLDITTARFRLSVVAGSAQTAVPADRTRLLAAQFMRTVFAGRVGWNVDSSLDLALTFAKVRDDTASLQSTQRVRWDSMQPQTSEPGALPGDTLQNRLAARPSEGYNAALNVRWNITREIRASVEFAGCFTTHNMFDPVIGRDQLPNGWKWLADFFNAHASTSPDVAAKLAVTYEKPDLSLAVRSSLIGANYRSLLRPWITRNQFDIDMAGTADFEDGRFSLQWHGSYWQGFPFVRARDVTLVDNSTGWNAAADFTAAINERWSLSLSGEMTRTHESGSSGDTAGTRIDAVTTMPRVALSPTFSYATESMSHVVNARYQVLVTRRYGAETGTSLTHDIGAAYTIELSKIPIEINIDLLRSIPVADSLAPNQIEIAATITTSLLGTVLRPTLTAGYVSSNSGDGTSDRQWSLRPGLVIAPSARMRITLAGFASDTRQRRPAYGERRVEEEKFRGLVSLTF